MIVWSKFKPKEKGALIGISLGLIGALITFFYGGIYNGFIVAHKEVTIKSIFSLLSASVLIFIIFSAIGYWLGYGFYSLKFKISGKK